MPVVSQAQNAAMHAAAQGKSTLGIPKAVGQEFTAGQSPGSVKKLPEHKAPSRHHALSIASATHLHRAGHISDQQRDAIHAKARKGLEQAKSQPKPFGSLAP